MLRRKFQHCAYHSSIADIIIVGGGIGKSKYAIVIGSERCQRVGGSVELLTYEAMNTEHQQQLQWE